MTQQPELSAWPSQHPWCHLHSGFLLPPSWRQLSLCWGLWSWDRQRWPALVAPSTRTEYKVLGPQWQSQSERELNKKAGTAIGKLKAGEFREPSRGDLKPEEAAFHGRFPLPERKLLGTQPGFTSTSESGCGGDHSKDKKGGSCYPSIMLENGNPGSSKFSLVHPTGSHGCKILRRGKKGLGDTKYQQMQKVTELPKEKFVFGSKCVPYKLHVSKGPWPRKDLFL